MRVLFLFVDGVGIGPDDARNPFATGSLPALQGLLGGRLTQDLPAVFSPGLVFVPIDARLGIEGLPQSATGQTTIYTGQNAARMMGRHISGFPLARLRRLLEADNIYLAAKRKGKRVTFSNAYTAEFYRLKTTQRGWMSCSTRAILAAGETLRSEADLVNGRALFHDLTRARLAEMGKAVPVITPEQAAQDLLKLTERHDLTVHEYFLTDTYGHRQDAGKLGCCLTQYDRFLARLLAERPQELTILLTSDHGNCEDLSVRTHTLNPVPMLVVGPGAGKADRAKSLLDIAPLIQSILDELE